MNQYMNMAINEARLGIKKNHGGPFGTVIVKNGKVIAKAHNKVLKNKDATCHGEMEAIRLASKKLKNYDLSGCVLYTTGEPCNMCLCACMWANIDKVYYGATIEDNSKIGFRDEAFDNLFGDRKQLKDYLIMINRDECLDLFEEYNKMKRNVY
jgi:guanine deaminase